MRQRCALILFARKKNVDKNKKATAAQYYGIKSSIRMILILMRLCRAVIALLIVL